MELHYVGDWGALIHGEALETLKEMPSDSVDALCTDPPAGISWMPGTNGWDCFRRKNNPNDVGRDNVFGRTSATSPHSRGESDRDRFIEFLTPIMAEALRVLKPGAWGLVWAHSTTSYWTAMALDNAGFEVKECIFHLHAQGMPHCLNIGLDIDRVLGETSRIVGDKPWKNQDIRSGSLVGGREHEQLKVKEPVSPEGQQWNGWFSGVKPAVECWWLIQKPISESNIAKNVLRWGVGGLNIGTTSVTRAEDDIPGWHQSGANGSVGFNGTSTFRIREMSAEEITKRRAGKGRHTPNLMLSHHELCVRVGTHKVKGCPATVIQGGKDGGGYDVGSGDGTRRDVFEGYGDEEGMEEVNLYACVPGCPIRLIEAQAMSGKKERNVTRCFPKFAPWKFCPKPSRSEKEKGLNHLEPATLNRVNPGGLEGEPRFAPVKVKNTHSTVKSIPLCKWLLSLICPPDGLCLDPFAGSGSIGCAAGVLGMRYLGIEQGNPPQEDRYIRIALGRMEYWAAQRDKEIP